MSTCGRINVGGGRNTNDATATADKVLAGYIAYNANGKFEGSIPSKEAETITPSTAEQTIEAGQYLCGAQTIKAVKIDTPAAKNILTGYGVSVNSNGITLKSVSGSMTNQGAVKKTITPSNVEQSYTIPSGYHNGGGSVKVSAIQGKKGVVRQDMQYMNNKNYFGRMGTVGEYAVYAGGHNNGYLAAAEYFDKNLVHGSAPDMVMATSRMCKVTVGDYLLFAGGLEVDYISESYRRTTAKVSCYDSSLTRIAVADLCERKEASIGVSIDNRVALVAGGTWHNNSCYSTDTVDVYDASLTHSIAAPLTVSRGTTGGQNAKYAIGLAINHKAIIAGGSKNVSGASDNGGTLVVECYDKNLVHTTLENLVTERMYGAASGVVGDYAFIGNASSSYKAEYYTKDLVHGTLSTSNRGLQVANGVALGDVLVCAGGSPEKTVDTFSKDLVHGTVTSFTQNRQSPEATKVGEYALFAGGYYPQETAYDYVDVYKEVIIG